MSHHPSRISNKKVGDVKKSVEIKAHYFLFLRKISSMILLVSLTFKTLQVKYFKKRSIRLTPGGPFQWKVSSSYRSQNILFKYTYTAKWTNGCNFGSSLWDWKLTIKILRKVLRYGHNWSTYFFKKKGRFMAACNYIAWVYGP